MSVRIRPVHVARHHRDSWNEIEKGPGTMKRYEKRDVATDGWDFWTSITIIGGIRMTNKHSVGHLAVRKSTLSLGASMLPRSIAGYAAAFMIALSYGAQVHAQQAAGGDAKAGADKRSQCIGCHGIPGYKASFPRVYNVPMIAGQNAKYIEAALTAYRKGDRPHPTMRGIAGSLSDADIADLAAYYASR
ncbi:MAG: hypothetical protein RL585_1252 [Pseudomonadota bacterium]|jgi:cytochrome c553